jgi:hypothetical protein
MTNRYQGVARTNILKRFTHYEIASDCDPGAIRISLNSEYHYYVRPKLVEGENRRADGVPAWISTVFDAYPTVVHRDGKLWAEGNLFILYQAQTKFKIHKKLSTRQFSNTAEDLAAYLRFIEDSNVDWLNFPELIFTRPTYRFRRHTSSLVENHQISHSVGRRRMMTAVHLYRWLIKDCSFSPAYPPWEEKDVYLPITTQIGFSKTIKVKSVDITNIPGKPTPTPYDIQIYDGGKLRPNPEQEQKLLIESLIAYGNTELTLAHYFGLFVGARVQTILTVRKRHFWDEPTDVDQWEDIRLRVGPGYGIDTKNNKRLVLHVPPWLYHFFRAYAHSGRAQTRRLRATGGDIDEQYLLLTTRGNPFYESMQAHEALGEVHSGRRYSKAGGAMRTLISENIIPYIQKKYDPSFHYQLHDLRATFGMNLVDSRLEKFGYTETLKFVQGRLGHDSPTTTERYLNYRHRIQVAQKIQDSWEAQLQSLARQALEKNVV